MAYYGYSGFDRTLHYSDLIKEWLSEGYDKEKKVHTTTNEDLKKEFRTLEKDFRNAIWQFSTCSRILTNHASRSYGVYGITSNSYRIIKSLNKQRKLITSIRIRLACKAVKKRDLISALYYEIKKSKERLRMLQVSLLPDLISYCGLEPYESYLNEQGSSFSDDIMRFYTTKELAMKLSGNQDSKIDFDDMESRRDYFNSLAEEYYENVISIMHENGLELENVDEKIEFYENIRKKRQKAAEEEKRQKRMEILNNELEHQIFRATSLIYDAFAKGESRGNTMVSEAARKRLSIIATDYPERTFSVVLYGRIFRQKISFGYLTDAPSLTIKKCNIVNAQRFSIEDEIMLDETLEKLKEKYADENYLFEKVTVSLPKASAEIFKDFSGREVAYRESLAQFAQQRTEVRAKAIQDIFTDSFSMHKTVCQDVITNKTLTRFEKQHAEERLFIIGLVWFRANFAIVDIEDYEFDEFGQSDKDHLLHHAFLHGIKDEVMHEGEVDNFVIKAGTINGASLFTSTNSADFKKAYAFVEKTAEEKNRRSSSVFGFYLPTVFTLTPRKPKKTTKD